MKKSLTYGVVFCLLAGFFALTSDIETYVDSWKNPVAAQVLDNESADDSGDSLSISHISDIFTDTYDNHFTTSNFQVRRITLPSYSIQDLFICSIWQPPKLS